jgi:hypothetical protein
VVAAPHLPRAAVHPTSLLLQAEEHLPPPPLLLSRTETHHLHTRSTAARSSTSSSFLLPTLHKKTQGAASHRQKVVANPSINQANMLTIKRVPTLVSINQDLEQAAGCGKDCLGSCCMPGTASNPFFFFNKHQQGCCFFKVLPTNCILSSSFSLHSCAHPQPLLSLSVKQVWRKFHHSCARHTNFVVSLKD